MSISVVIPAYNAARFIVETLQSVLAQSLVPDEIIVIDDGSSDNTADLAEALSPSIRVIRRTNEGQASSRNFGVQQAASEWIAFLDADDLWEPNKLKSQIEKIKQNSAVDLCYTARREFLDADGTRTSGHIIPVPSTSDLRQALFRNTTFLPSSVVIRRSVFLAVGGFDTQIRLVEDWDLWLRLLRHGIDFASCPEPLLLYRVHANSMSHDAIASLVSARKIFRKHVLPSLPARTRWLASLRSDSGQEAAAAVALRRTGDPRHLVLMVNSLVHWPFGRLLRYKILTHMVYTQIMQRFR